MSLAAFQHVCASLPEPTLLVAPDGCILAANPASSELLGLPEAEISRRSLYGLAGDGQQEKIARLLHMWERSRELLPGSIALTTGGTRQLHCRAQGGLLQPASSGAAAVILVRLFDQPAATAAFRTLNERIEKLNAEIAHRQRSEAELDAQREWLSTTLRSIGDAVLATDRDGRVIFMNSVAENLTGWTDEESRGQPLETVFNIVNEQTRAAVAAPVARVFAEGTIVGLSNHTILIARDGNEIPIDDSGAPIRDRDGRLTGAVLVFRDITDRRRAEQSLRDSEARYRFLFQSTLDGILIVDDRGVYVEVNESFCRMLKAPRERLLGAHFSEFIPPERQQEAAEAFAALRESRPTPVDFPLRAIDGTIVELEWTSVSSYLPGLHFCACRDVTDRKRHVRDLAESEERLRLAQAAAGFGVWDWNVQSGEVRWSGEIYEFAGLDPARVKPSFDLWTSVIHPDDRETAEAAVQAALAGLDLLRVEFRILRPDGSVRWLISRGRLFRDHDGRPVRMVGVNADLTERKQTEAALRATNVELRRLNAELEEFAFVAAHDLQEPLRMVNTYTELLVRRFGSSQDSDVREFSANIRSGVGRMELLIHDLLRYSRIVHEEENALAVTGLAAALRDALTLLEEPIRSNRASITHGDLPIVRGDASQLSVVFENLLSNALKYRRPEEPPRIDIHAERNGSEWLIRVRDNGIGFHPRYAERVFGLFKRLHSDPAVPGTGLGLAISRRIVERYGGRMWAESKPGEGATFFFTLQADLGAQSS